MPVRIGNWVVDSDSETFRIFPKNKKGKTIPITRINHFLYLRCQLSGMLIVFKRYLHQKNWYWRDSRDQTWTTESAVIDEVARMLFSGDTGKAQDVLLAMLTNAPIPHGESLTGMAA